MYGANDRSPAVVRQRPSPLFWAGLLAAPLLLIVIAQLLGEESIVSRAVRLAFRPLCHQDPERSFAIGGTALVVCARCTGFYAGLAVVALIGAGARQAGFCWRVPGAAFLLILPLALDGAGNLLGVWNTGPALRALTGVAAAAPLALAMTGCNHGLE